MPSPLPRRPLILSLSVAALTIPFTSPVVAQEPATRPFVVGTLTEPRLGESSGIVESRRHPGVYWTLNDSGNDAILFAIRKDGSLINAFAVQLLNRDWEDIAIDDDGQLYIGDIGNNGYFTAALSVTQVDEPDPFIAPAPKARLQPKRQWLLTFANNDRMDCESLFIWQGHGYLLRKSFDRAPTTLWRFDLAADRPQNLQLIATLPIDAICTGADLSADGDRLAVMSVDGPYLFDGLKGDLASIATRPASFIRIDRRINEAICFTSETNAAGKPGLLGTSETREVYFFPFDAFRPAAATETTRPATTTTTMPTTKPAAAPAGN